MRNGRLLAGALAGLALTLTTACTDGPRQPVSPEVPDVRADVTGGTYLACDLKQVDRLAKDVFGPSDTEHRELARDFTDAVEAEDFGLARDLGFDLIAASIDPAVDAPGSDQQKSDFANQLLVCADVDDDGDLEGPSIDFTTAISLGSFGVRGGENPATVMECETETGTNDPFIAAVVASGHTPVWLIEPFDATWCEVFESRRLVWGEPVTLDSDETEVPTDGGTDAFDWQTVPSGPFASGERLLVGVCAEGEGWHVLKGTSGGTEILPFAAPTSAACEGIVSNDGLAARLFRLTTAVLGPRPLHADAAAVAGGLGGLAGSLTPFVGVDPVALSVSFLPPVPDETNDGEFENRESDGRIEVGQRFSIRVDVRAAGGTPMPDVEVVLTVDGNEGSTVVLADGGSNCAESVCTDETDESGIVTFRDLTLNKTGGYRLRASVELVDGSLIEGDSDITATAVSTLFHVNQN